MNNWVIIFFVALFAIMIGGMETERLDRYGWCISKGFYISDIYWAVDKADTTEVNTFTLGLEFEEKETDKLILFIQLSKGVEDFIKFLPLTGVEVHLKAQQKITKYLETLSTDYYLLPKKDYEKRTIEMLQYGKEGYFKK